MLKIDLPKPTNCGDCFLCRSGKCEKAYEAYLKMGGMFFKAIYEPDFMLDDCPIEEIDEAQMPKEGVWITTRTENHDGEIYCSVCDHDAPTEGDYRQVKTNYCPNCGAKMTKGGDR